MNPVDLLAGAAVLSKSSVKNQQGFGVTLFLAAPLFSRASPVFHAISLQIDHAAFNGASLSENRPLGALKRSPILEPKIYPLCSELLLLRSHRME